jgi:hypothetical protein
VCAHTLSHCYSVQRVLCRICIFIRNCRASPLSGPERALSCELLVARRDMQMRFSDASVFDRSGLGVTVDRCLRERVGG